MVAKAEGKIVVRANKRVAARIMQASKESVGKREWVVAVEQLARKKTKMKRRTNDEGKR